MFLCHVSEPGCIRPNYVRGEKDSLLDNTVEDRGRFLISFITDELRCSGDFSSRSLPTNCVVSSHVPQSSVATGCVNWYQRQLWSAPFPPTLTLPPGDAHIVSRTPFFPGDGSTKPVPLLPHWQRLVLPWYVPYACASIYGS